jgi:SAM-dependent methyltransferase
MAQYSGRGALTFGVDPSLEMLAEARKKSCVRGKVVRAEASHLPFGAGIADVTICSFALSYFSDLFQSLHELSRITKNRGRIVISDLHPAAVARGWTRSFRVGDNTYEIAHPHHPDEHLDIACKQAKLDIVSQQEAGFSEPERSIFVAAGKEHLYPKVIGIPAVRVIVCAKV